MTQARGTLVSLADTPYYHCIGRCVRRAFLCGKDELTGENYEHRRQWIVDRLALLTRAFTIDLCAYSVMSNHYHLVLHIDQKRAEELSETEVMERWSMVVTSPLPVLLCRYAKGETTSKAEDDEAREIIATLRERLYSLSWFMRRLNEFIAKKANKEDGCSGHFWQARFKSQALLDEAAVLTCMSYADLNPVRAGMAPTPEASDYTSVQARIREHKAPFILARDERPPVRLMPFQDADIPDVNHLPFSLMDYLELMDWTGRAVLPTKSGAISAATPPILTRLGINPEEYLKTMRPRGNPFYRAVGRVEALRSAATRLKQHFLCGLGQAKLLFGEPAG